ncbi:270_t:CDS:2 [Racocetra fulgida]|uniref:270_t:CDS:1 n=1 Tax=Racocetra fulgida TaxID=60492 RepID=A0A9N9EYD1_9GLOM|nr:270_t:CDS:2 [Racocetra fulgida]
MNSQQGSSTSNDAWNQKDPNYCQDCDEYKTCKKKGHIAKHCIKVIELDYCAHCGSTEHVRKKDCTEIKLLKEQQAKKYKCDQTEVQLAIQENFML